MVVLLENQSNVAVVVVVEGKQQICCGGVFKLGHAARHSKKTMTSYEKRGDHHVTNAGQKKKSGSPTIIERLTFRNRSDALTTELQRPRGKLGHIQGSCMTCVLVLRVDAILEWKL